MQNTITKAPTAAIYTLGCKVNQYESEAIREALVSRGFRMTDFDDDADVYIINTCTVTAESDRKACQVIRRAARHRDREGRMPCVIVTGCMAQTQADRILAIEGVSYLCGSRNKLSCVDMAVEFLAARGTDSAAKEPVSAVYNIEALGMEPMSLKNSGMERTRAYIKIEDGCENHCTYCAIPGARGRVVSKAPEDVIREVGALLENGYREIVLTGIEIASYGRDFKDRTYHLIDLLEDVENAYPTSPVRYRLGSMEPTYMKPETVSRMAALKKLAPQFHLSLQSGADHVLHSMKRKYSMTMIRAILADIREKIPDVMFTTDIMTGFPGETEEDAAQTMAFAREARLLHIHVFPYSRRKNTEADKMPGQLPNEEKNRRANALIALQKEIEADIYRKHGELGGEVRFLPETYHDGIVTGHTDNFMEVRIPVAKNDAEAVMENKTLRRVRITGADELHLTGEFLD
ncbi:MAG: tRNA (N(6)-L-threonylcarbamoyladenosine(37)-C(2))-methylthiotransferase MtaB [Clostridia bacterium]|nr:tRNA (N(6)-L-threonylcarbamoyladenosine(37)-C(2))-methylthiotransferase MtaB [Clostridia bacterium]